MIIGFGNNVVSSLAADITATQTTIQVMPGAGALFAALLTYDYTNDSNPLKAYAKITLTDAKETVFEVCHLTAVSNDMLTVVRGQEGTAKGWSLNDVIANFATRGSENQFIQIEQLQSGHYTSAAAGGTANGLTLALPATYFLNGSTDWALKTPILIYPILNNTGASTLQLTMGGRVMGTYPLVKGSNTALHAGDIVAKNPFLAVFNAEQGRFIVLNPTTDAGSVRSVNSIVPDVGGNVTLTPPDIGAAKQSGDTNQKFWVLSAPGDVNSAVPVSLLNSELQKKANLNGDAGQKFKVKGVTDDNEAAVAMWQLVNGLNGKANLKGDSNVDFYVRNNGDATAAVNNTRLNYVLGGYAYRGGDPSQGFAVAGGTSSNSAVAYNQFQSGNNGNGAWVKLPGGGQWCRSNLNLIANGNTTWTFPASFPNTPGIYITTINGEFKCWMNGAGPSDCSIYNNGPALNVNVFAIW